ncbi:hypothetical protein [Actinosynnema mirum]|uniref:Uncharacterized protein n=1 Tax=Actinosynnema mirum (strain ATCC 29888 / DSM 43827 / JCM 3225 / NBRC 14064 / NCIMB 13271 / NRRL B-12336 / IMRU 3971 / 101) TaxID=446462 RepID=C6WBC6_ACTMD|nr:hypothetical protein [Actinosynnema mirum]ACU39417.1 hypothetical protein Amir_5599 [Actinosynnema mirum DSM 43827]
MLNANDIAKVTAAITKESRQHGEDYRYGVGFAKGDQLDTALNKEAWGVAHGSPARDREDAQIQLADYPEDEMFVVEIATGACKRGRDF